MSHARIEGNSPALSVVVPTYNRRALLERCLTALRHQAGLTAWWEVIVVDDGSTDGTWDLCHRLATEWPLLRCVRQPNRGPAAARNTGIQHARGSVVVFTDDDCVPPTDWLRRIAERFEREPDLAGLGGVMVTPADEWLPLSHHSDIVEPNEADCSSFIGTNNAAYRRSALLSVGGFDEAFRHVSVEDADLYIRLERMGYKLLIDPALWVYHPARPDSLKSALCGYVRFWAGYRALEARYPLEFRRIYRSGTLGAVIKGRSWTLRLRRHIPGLLRNPWRGLQFLCYLALSRAIVLLLHAGRWLGNSGFVPPFRRPAGHSTPAKNREVN